MKKYCLIIFLSSLALFLSAQNQLKTTSANLNLRKNPWIDNNIICVIPKSSLLTIDYSNQRYNEWIKINYSGNVGYVYSKYLINPQFKSAFSNKNDFANSSSRVKYYTNSKGEKVQSPTFYNKPPAGATAVCRDGTYSFSRNRKGTCSHHGGVARWL
jgi:uncharacterized protein YgiM (DUF1202 family)